MFPESARRRIIKRIGNDQNYRLRILEFIKLIILLFPAPPKLSFLTFFNFFISKWQHLVNLKKRTKQLGNKSLFLHSYIFMFIIIFIYQK